MPAGSYLSMVFNTFLMRQMTLCWDDVLAGRTSVCESVVFMDGDKAAVSIPTPVTEKGCQTSMLHNFQRMGTS